MAKSTPSTGRSSKKPLPERRGHIRHPPDPEAACDVTLVVGDESWPARIHNISAEGIGLRLHRSPPPGALAAVELVSRSGLFRRRLELRVIHVLRADDGRYLVGGAFTDGQLSTEELRALLT